MSTANRSAVERTPLPWPEISVALVVLTTEAISFQYLFPFVPFMVRGFGIREEDVGFYAGGIASAFMVGQFFSSFFWGRMSDMIGLKPVMLIGMTFTCITVALFGVSKSLEWAMATRFIGGAHLFSFTPTACLLCGEECLRPDHRPSSQAFSTG